MTGAQREAIEAAVLKSTEAELRLDAAMKLKVVAELEYHIAFRAAKESADHFHEVCSALVQQSLVHDPCTLPPRGFA
jgi:hypothetical protein